MASPEDREKHQRRIKRNAYAKELRTSGAFKMRVIPPKKEYKREKISVKEVLESTEGTRMRPAFEDELVRKLESLFEYYSEDMTMNEILEMLNLEPVDAFIHLYYTSFIDDEDLEDYWQA